MPAANEDPLKRERRLLRKLSEDPTPDQVHGFRTTSRRIEALLAAVLNQPGKNERKLLKQLARVRRRAGRVRDFDVQMGNLQTLNIGREAECKELVLQRLKDKRKKATKRLLASLDKRTVQRIEKRLLRTARKVSKARPTGSGARSEGPRPIDAADFTARRLQKLQNKLPLSEETLHEYRLRGKRMRYTLELSSDPEAPRLIEQLKGMQDAIGKWHDSVVLLENAQAAIDHNGSCPLIAALRNLSKAQLWQALQLTRSALASLAGSPGRKPIRKAAPLTAAASA